MGQSPLVIYFANICWVLFVPVTVLGRISKMSQISPLSSRIHRLEGKPAMGAHYYKTGFSTWLRRVHEFSLDSHCCFFIPLPTPLSHNKRMLLSRTLALDSHKLILFLTGAEWGKPGWNSGALSTLPSLAGWLLGNHTTSGLSCKSRRPDTTPRSLPV